MVGKLSMLERAVSDLDTCIRSLSDAIAHAEAGDFEDEAGHLFSILAMVRQSRSILFECIGDAVAEMEIDQAKERRTE